MIFRWLYIRRIRAMFGQFMLPGAFEEKIVPLIDVSEVKALRYLFDSYFPGSVLAKASANDLVELRNKIHQALAASPSKHAESMVNGLGQQADVNKREGPPTTASGA